MKRVLIVNPFGIGDVIFSMVPAEVLRRERPEVEIGFLCNERAADLVRMNTAIDHTFIFHRDLMRRLWRRHPLLVWRKLKGLLAAVKDPVYDTMIDLSLGREYSFFGALAGIRRRIGFNYRGRGFFLTDKMPLRGYHGRHAVDIQLDLLEMLGITPTRGKARLSLHVSLDAKSSAEAFLKRSAVKAGGELITVAPGGGKTWGANASYKQWAPERFAEAANRLTLGSDCKVLLVGDRAERPLLQRVSGLLREPGIFAAGETLERVSALLLRSRFFLGNDGGLLHLANALGVRSASVYGPVDAVVYGPYGSDTTHAVVAADVACRPCYKDFHFPPCRFERRCQEQISVDAVVDAAKKVLRFE